MIVDIIFILIIYFNYIIILIIFIYILIFHVSINFNDFFILHMLEMFIFLILN
jgi:hypothetical protein